MANPNLEVDIKFKNVEKESSRAADNIVAALNKKNTFSTAFALNHSNTMKTLKKAGEAFLEKNTIIRAYSSAFKGVFRKISPSISDSLAESFAKSFVSNMDKEQKKQEKTKSKKLKFMDLATTTISPEWKRLKREASKNETAIGKEIQKSLGLSNSLEANLQKEIAKNRQKKFEESMQKMLDLDKKLIEEELQGQKDFNKYRIESEEEKSKADYEHYKEKKNREKKEEYERKKRMAALYKKAAFFFGKWGTYGIFISTTLRAIKSIADGIMARSQEALSYQRAVTSGAFGAGWGKMMGSWAGAGFSGKDFKSFMTNLQMQRGMLSLGMGNAGLWGMLGISAYDSPNVVYKKLISRLKQFPEATALALGTQIGLSPDQVVAAREGDYDKAGPVYSESATKSMALAGKKFNRMKAYIDAFGYNLTGSVVPGIMEAFASPFELLRGVSPSTALGVGQKLTAQFGDVNVVINNADGTQIYTTGKIEQVEDGEFKNAYRQIGNNI